MHFSPTHRGSFLLEETLEKGGILLEQAVLRFSQPGGPLIEFILGLLDDFVGPGVPCSVNSALL